MMVASSILTSGDLLDSVLVALSTRGTRTMAPAKVTDAFQATKRGRGVAKGKPKAKSVRAAGAYPCVRLVGMLVEKKIPPPDSDRDDWLTSPTPADTKPENDTTEEYLNILKSFDMTSVRPPRVQTPRYFLPTRPSVGRPEMRVSR
jgi:hypothetical protein